MKPKISVIIPVLHEDGINEALLRLKQLARTVPVEVIVVDGAPEMDTTGRISVEGVIKLASRKGRAFQMNAGAEIAQGDILLFLHADTKLPEDAFEDILNCTGCGYVAGAFELGIDSDKKIYRITERYVKIRTKLTRIPFGDQAIFVERRFFDKIGRFREVPVMEDVELMRRIKRLGSQVCSIPKKVRTSPRRYEQEGIIYCTVRNMVLQLLFSFGVSPGLLARFYR